MKHLLTVCLIAIVGVASAQAVAQDRFPTPTPAVAFQAPAYSDEIAPPPAATFPPAVTSQAYPPDAHYPVGPAPVLYTDVKVRHARKIHPCAVPTIVEVPDPCDRCCTVLVEICAPPCECVCVERRGLLKRKTRFDYGEYKVDVISRNGKIIVVYRA